MAVPKRKTSPLQKNLNGALRAAKSTGRLQDQIHADAKKAADDLGVASSQLKQCTDMMAAYVDDMMSPVSDDDVNHVLAQINKDMAKDLEARFPAVPKGPVASTQKPMPQQSVKKPVSENQKPTQKVTPNKQKPVTLRAHLMQDGNKAQYKEFHAMVSKNEQFYHRSQNRQDESACFAALNQSMRFLSEFYGKENKAVQSLQSQLDQVGQLRAQSQKGRLPKSTLQLKESQLAQKMQKALLQLKNTVVQDFNQKFSPNHNASHGSQMRPGRR